MNELQDRLNDLLIEKNLSRETLAKSINISPAVFSGYFNLDYYPQIDIAIKLAKFFDCSLDYLFV